MFENLRCSKEGLTSEAAEERLTIFGHNKLEEKQVIFFLLLIIHGSLCFYLLGFGELCFLLSC